MKFNFNVNEKYNNKYRSNYSKVKTILQYKYNEKKYKICYDGFGNGIVLKNLRPDTLYR